MKINKLGVILGFAVATASSHVVADGTNAASDTATDSHTVSVTVPDVALLDIVDDGGNAPSITCEVPNNDAGANMTCTATNATVAYHMTSNIEANSSKSRTITASINETIDPSWKLEITPDVPTEGTEVLGTANSGADINFAGVAANATKTLVTGIQNGATTGGSFEYSLEPTNGAALAHRTSATPLTVTYTITDDL